MIFESSQPLFGSYFRFFMLYCFYLFHREQRYLEMQQLYGSPPNPHQHSPLPAVHPSYHGNPHSHHSPDSYMQESYSVHSSGQSANTNGYYSGERSVGYKGNSSSGNKSGSAYANGNLVNGHRSPYSTPSPVRTKVIKYNSIWNVYTNIMPLHLYSLHLIPMIRIHPTITSNNNYISPLLYTTFLQRKCS